MRRRKALGFTLAGLAALSLPALAQPQGRVRRIGYLGAGSVQANAPWVAAFREGMAELRWVEGRDYVIDARYASGIVEAVAGLADELVATQPDLMLTTAEGPAIPLAQRTKTIPIVFALASDPVGVGLAASLRRPGGNVTGLTSMARDLGAKRLQLLKEAFPRVARVALVYSPNDAAGASQVREIEEAASRLGLRFSPIELRGAADIEPALKRGAALGAQAYLVAQGFLINTQRRAIMDRIMSSRVPAMYAGSEYVEDGGLMSYSPSIPDNYRRAAGYVDRILKGARPGDLPIEQPVKFELVINLKTAKAMGLAIPQAILLRADRVIQ